MQDVERPAPFGAGSVKHGSVADDIPRPVKELRGNLAGLYGQALGQILNVLELSLNSERQFEIARRQVFDIFGEKERVMKVMVARIWAKGEARNGDAKDSDNG